MPDKPSTPGLEPLPVRLRRRREELNLRQEDIAELLRVTTESVGKWERGQRMELGKLPSLAAALQLDPCEVCRQGLAEFHPSVYAALFGGALDYAKRPGSRP